MANRNLSIRYVHKISPRDTDVCECNTIADSAFADRRTLAAALRARGILVSGTRLREMRVEADRVVCFPDRGVWHSLVITFLPEPAPYKPTTIDVSVSSVENALHAVYRDVKACNGEFPVDVRLQAHTTDRNDFTVRWGDASFDLDHSGYWGAGTLDHDTIVRDLAEALVREADEMASQDEV